MFQLVRREDRREERRESERERERENGLFFEGRAGKRVIFAKMR
jgi:hypothetical protein